MSQLSSKISICLSILMLSLPPSSLADVSVTEQGMGKDAAKALWTRTIHVKGFKMRIDFQGHSGASTTIYDLEKGKRFRLDSGRREVFVMDLASEGERWKSTLMFDRLRKIVKATGKQLEISGMACDEYTYDFQAPSRPTQGYSSILHDHGIVCVSQTIPGGIDIATFVREAKKRGFLSAAAPCSPNFSPLAPSFFGDQPNVLILSSQAEFFSELPISPGAIGRNEINVKVTEVHSDTISDEIFQFPAEWKLKKEPDYR